MVTLFRLILCLCPPLLYAWGENGHVLISHLAYANMRPDTQAWLHHQLSRSKNKPSAGELNRASIWLDKARAGRYRSLGRLHYIDLAYGDENLFSAVDKKNAVSALLEAERNLTTPGISSAKTKFNLKIILHVIADLHQPMHSITYYSNDYPHGDRGGNLYRIQNIHYRGSLHRFWDEGAGWLKGFSWHDQEALAAKMKYFSTMHCSDFDLNPSHWAQDSYLLAKRYAYFPPEDQDAFQDYQLRAQTQVKQQIFKAACHLAAYLNHLCPRA